MNLLAVSFKREAEIFHLIKYWRTPGFTNLVSWSKTLIRRWRLQNIERKIFSHCKSGGLRTPEPVLLTRGSSGHFTLFGRSPLFYENILNEQSIVEWREPEGKARVLSFCHRLVWIFHHRHTESAFLGVWFAKWITPRFTPSHQYASKLATFSDLHSCNLHNHISQKFLILSRYK